ncbi:MAG: HAMP domain-containing sensor histidine kinase [Planctomycetota bacterium]
MNDWSIARRSALWFGGLLLTLLLALVGCSYVMLSSYMSRQLDDEVDELGAAASSQLEDATEDEARSFLELLVSEGTDLGLGFIFERSGEQVRAGRAELAEGIPDDVEPRTWRRGSVSINGGGFLRIGIDGATRANDLNELPGTMAIISMILAGIAALAAWLFGRRMGGLVTAVADDVNPSGAVPPQGAPREIRQLVDAINEGFLRAEDAQARSKLLVVGAAHALRSPIQALLSQAQSTLRRDRDSARYRKTLEDQEQELTEFARSVDNLVTFCAEGGGNHASEKFDLMAEVRLRLQPDDDRARRGGVILTIDGPLSLQVQAERESIILAIRNLVSNALSVSASGQRVYVSTKVEESWVQITVDDEGPGIPETERERVFEPMRRVPGAHEGAGGRARYGLGLALVRRAMDDHGGSASIEDGPLGGARLRLHFPVEQSQARSESPA